VKEKQHSGLTTIRYDLKDAWGFLYKDPLATCEKAVSILHEVRSQKGNSQKQINNTETVLFELQALHLLGCAYYHSGNRKQAIVVANELQETSSECKNEEYVALAEQIIAKTEIQDGNWENAKQRLLRILPILEHVANYEFVQSVLIDISNIEHAHNNYEAALSLLLRAETLYHEYPVNPNALSVIMSNMADVYLRLGNLEKAIEYIAITIEEAKKVNNVQQYSNALLRLSGVYSRQGETEKQIETLNESIEVLLNQHKNHQIAIRRIALGTAYMNINDFNNSLAQFSEAFPHLEEKNDRKNLGLLHQRMGLLYSHPSFEHKNSDAAQGYFLKAEQIANELAMTHFQSAVLGSRAEAYASFGLFEESLTHLKKSISLEKQVLNEKSFRQLHELENRHKMALKEKEIELLAAHNKMLELERIHLQEQLSMNNQYLFMYKKELNNFKSDINSITKQLDKAENIVRKVKMKLRESASAHETWESYLEIFSKVHPDFQTKLKAAYPALTSMEVKVCVLIRAGLLSEEIAEILSLSERTIENKRFSIRNKLQLKDREKLDKFLEQI